MLVMQLSSYLLLVNEIHFILPLSCLTIFGYNGIVRGILALNKVNINSGMNGRRTVDKPLPEPILIELYDTI